MAKSIPKISAEHLMISAREATLRYSKTQSRPRFLCQSNYALYASKPIYAKLVQPNKTSVGVWRSNFQLNCWRKRRIKAAAFVVSACKNLILSEKCTIPPNRVNIIHFNLYTN
jgi:hypothetical protein